MSATTAEPGIYIASAREIPGIPGGNSNTAYQNGSCCLLRKEHGECSLIMADEHSSPKKLRLDSHSSSYLSLPPHLTANDCLVNVQNLEDNECFRWSVLAALHPDVPSPQSVSSYESFRNDLKFEGLNFPIKPKDIPLFEEQNGLSVNVYSCYNYSYGRELKYPVYVSKLNKKAINLFLFSSEEKVHYSWIKKPRPFFGTYASGAYCPYCLKTFGPNSNTKDHKRLCSEHVSQLVALPRESYNTLNLQAQKDLIVPFIIYADFECMLENELIDENDPSEKKVLKIHKPCGYAYKVVGPNQKDSKSVVVYRGDDAAEKLVNDLIKEESEIVSKLGSKDSKNWIPVVFHCLSRYDSHIIIQVLEKFQNTKMTCLPQSTQEFISFSIGSLNFIDSYRFLKKSLAVLVSDLEKSSDDLKQTFSNTFLLAEDNEDLLKLLLRKQVYPYEYIDTMSRFGDKKLPPKETFYDNMKYKDISEEDYKHAQKVWKEFNIKTLGDYHDLYVKTDVLLLADVFEHFRKTSLEYYKLDPANFYSTPGLSFQAALLMKKDYVELLTDIDMHLMIENGIRGGVAMISHRYSKANNPSIPGFDSSKPKKWIIYLDANNCVGWTMSQPLPIGNFRWLSEQEISDVQTKIVKDKDTFKLHDFDHEETGYILEVDLDYPKELHDQHNDFPLAPEKIEVTSEMLSPYCKDLLQHLNTKEASGDKLIPNLMSKEKYVVYYRTLKLYLKLGMKIRRVHRVMSFRQTPWLKPYIDFNTEKRRESTSDVQKDFFKLMNNIVFGKTIENVRNYDKHVEFVFDDKDLDKQKANPNFLDCVEVNQTKIVQLQKPSLYLNKPISTGFTVLDLSKAFIYDFHYSEIKAKYGNKANLLFTDTDSLCYEIETEDIYMDLKGKPELYDFSNYPEEHEVFSDRNKNVVGKMKDETKGVPVESFVGLKPKMYSLKYGGQEKNTAVGVQKDYANKYIRFKGYLECLNEKKQHEGEIYRIESLDHQLRSVKETRKTLTPYDDKRYILDDGIQSLAYGNSKIPKDSTSETGLLPL